MPHFHAGGSDGVKPTSGGTFIAGEESIHGVILLHLAAIKLEKEDAATQPEIGFKYGMNQRGIVRDDIELFLTGRLKNVQRGGTGGQADIGQGARGVFMTRDGVSDGRGECSMHDPLHRPILSGGPASGNPPPRVL